jgi:hypothetical protein
VFYQVFDKGMLRDGEGRDIDFKNTDHHHDSRTPAPTRSTSCAPIPRPCRDAAGLAEALRPGLLKTLQAGFPRSRDHGALRSRSGRDHAADRGAAADERIARRVAERTTRQKFTYDPGPARRHRPALQRRSNRAHATLTSILTRGLRRRWLGNSFDRAWPTVLPSKSVHVAMDDAGRFSISYGLVSTVTDGWRRPAYMNVRSAPAADRSGRKSDVRRREQRPGAASGKRTAQAEPAARAGLVRQTLAATKGEMSYAYLHEVPGHRRRGHCSRAREMDRTRQLPTWHESPRYQCDGQRHQPRGFGAVVSEIVVTKGQDDSSTSLFKSSLWARAKVKIDFCKTDKTRSRFPAVGT